MHIKYLYFFICFLFEIFFFKARCTTHRTDRGACIPLKIKNRSFYYMIDKNGIFVNPNLFDYTMG